MIHPAATMKASGRSGDDGSGRGGGDGTEVGGRRSVPPAPVARLVGHEGPINAVRFTADGKFCLTAGHDRTVRLWNPTRLDPAHAGDKVPPQRGGGGIPSAPRALPIQTYSDGHSHPVSAVAVDDGSTTLLSTSDRALVATDLVARRVLRRLHGHTGRINAVACAGGGADAYVSGSYDGTVRVWDGRSRSRDPIQVLSEVRDSVTAVAALKGGGAAEILAASVDGTVRTYDLRAGRVSCDDLGDPVTGMALSRDGRCLAATCLDGAIRLLERSTGELLQTYSGGHEAGRYGLNCDITADDAYVVSGSEDGSVVLYDLVEGKVAHTLEGHSRPTCSVVAHPKRERATVVVSASYDGQAAVWADPKDISL